MHPIRSLLFIFLSVILCLHFANGQWTQINGPGIFVRNLTTISNGLGDTSLFASGSGVYFSTNGGTTWTAANNGLTDTDVRAFFTNGLNIYAGTMTGGVFLSTNNGSNWTAINNGIPTGTFITALTFTGTNIFAGTAAPGGVFRSSNNGSSWSQANNGMTYTNITAMTKNSVGVFVANSGGVFISTDQGSSWTGGYNGLQGGLIQSLAANSNYLYAGTTFSNVFISTNNGANWTAIHNGMPDSAYVNSLYATGTIVLAGTSRGVYLSFDNGNNWSNVNAGLSNNNIYSFILIGSSVFAAAGYGGIWHRPLSEMVTAVDNDQNLVRSYILAQNYPNPFNPSTKIQYSLPVRSSVRLVIYNVLGQVVKELINTEQQAGYQTVAWNANVASGMYFYRIIATSVDGSNKNFVETKKMLLLK
ncbi:MAG TPA: T9SS type A sorting domain-containing protein [Bacteroidota bacterium]|nr:T9SS type A sorting domain-containing protein [Bacteroidota bacterium]